MRVFSIFGGGGFFDTAAQNMPMTLLSLHFLLFLPAAALVYYRLPHGARRPFLLVASYYFYLFSAPRYFVVLLLGTVFTFIMGRCAGAAATQRGRRVWAATGIICSLLLLCFFKYNDFFAAFLAPALSKIGVVYDRSYFIAAEALGISYYLFTAIGYLIEVGGGQPAERDPITYALFLGFFPSVSLGPINRAGGLLTQLQNPNAQFDAQNAADALRIMAMGYFKKLAVADTLGIFTGIFYADADAYGGFTGLTLTAAAALYMLQLYFDFSGYSDIAFGTAKLLGFTIPQNFQNPFFSTNFSSFWARWHISLSSWLQDYVFTPLVWSRWTQKLPVLGKRVQKPPVLSSIAIVFLLSGIWHGDTLCFVVWGALQAVFRIGEELLHRHVGKPRKKPGFWLRVGKTAVVLVLWCQSLVFFRIGTMRGGSVRVAAAGLVRQFAGVSLSGTAADLFGAVQAGFMPNERLAQLFILFCIGCTALALWADWAQCWKLAGAGFDQGFKRMPRPLRWVCYYLLIALCFAGFLMQNGGFGGGNFLYAGF